MEAFHSGERDVQERAGVRHFAEHVAGMIRPEIPPVAVKFRVGSSPEKFTTG